MTAFTWKVAGEVVGARAVDWLRGMAATAGVMQKGGDVGKVVQEVGSTPCAPHMDVASIRAYS